MKENFQWIFLCQPIYCAYFMRYSLVVLHSSPTLLSLSLFFHFSFSLFWLTCFVWVVSFGFHFQYSTIKRTRIIALQSKSQVLAFVNPKGENFRREILLNEKMRTKSWVELILQLVGIISSVVFRSMGLFGPLMGIYIYIDK